MSIDIEKLEQRRFFLHGGFVYFWRRPADETRIAELVKKYGLPETQKLVNHEHLNFYVKDTVEQEKLAERLRLTWTTTLKQLLPTGMFIIESRTEAGETVVTVRNVPACPDSTNA